MLKALAILFATFGTYSVYVVVSGQSYFYAIGAVVTSVAAVGLWLRKPWSQYVVYFFSVTYTIQWLWLLWRAVSANLWPYETMSQTVISLIPGVLLLSFVIALSIIAYRSFNVKS